VFQHIPCHRGQRILKTLVGLLKEGGVGVIHFTYSKASLDANPFNAWPSSGPAYSLSLIRDLRCYLSGVTRVILRRAKRLVKRATCGSGEPMMQMNPYTLNPLFHVLQLSGIRNIYVEFTDHGGEYGLTLFFQKPLDHQ
jgi:hypothetical protein